MPHNVGTFDRWFRVLLGVLLLGLMFRGTIGYWGWLGLVPLLTGLANFCPVYQLFGWSSCRRDEHAHV